MRKIYVILTLGLLAFAPARLFNNTVQSLPFTQNWTTTTLITANDDWSGVPGIEGYLGQDITTSTGVDPQTLLTVSASPTDLDVVAQAAVSLTSGGVLEVDGIANPTIAMQGSGTADAPYILLNLATTGLQNITVAYNLRDLDASTDNAIQQFALQYRVGNTGSFTNVPAGYVADATQQSLATLVTPVNALLPAGCNNQSLIQVRIMTTNSAGNDELVGIDDINVTGSPLSGNSSNSDIIANGSFSAPSNINYATYQATDITDANSIEVAQFTIRDGGGAADGDALGTILTNLVMSLSNSANIRRVALYDGSTELAEVAGGATVNFSGLTVTAPDDGTKTFSVRVTFNSTVTDNNQFVFTVTSATADGAGSNFAAANAGGAVSSSTGDDNRIEVTADRLAFVQNTTSPTGVSAAMTPAPTVSANDANANRDLDFTAFVVITSTGTLQGTPISSQAVAGLSTFSGAIIHTATGTGLQLTAASSGLTSVTSNLFDIQAASSASDYFHSVTSGNWGSLGTWESSADNINWVPSTLIPDANANTITIRNTHTVTVAAPAGADQLVVEAGATLTLSAAFTLADGAGTDLDVSGTLVNSSGTHVFTGTSSFNANSLYQHNRNGGSAPTASWNVTSLFEVTGGTSTAPSNISQTLGNFTWNSNTTTTTNLLGGLTTVAGNFRVQNSGSASLRLSGSADLNLTVSGNFIIEDDLDIDNNSTGVCNISIGGNFVQTGGLFQSTTDIATITMTGSGKTFTQSAGTLTGTNINWVVNSGADLTLLNDLTIAVSRSLTAAGTVMTNSGTANINGIFQLNDGGWAGGTTGFVYGAAGTLVFNTTGNYGVNNDAYWPAASGPVNVTVQNTGGITMNVARTVTGLCQTAAGITNANNLTFNGTFQLNAGGYVSGAGRPFYGPASLLKYNTGGTYGRGNEWNCIAGLGCPLDLQISNSTILNVPNGAVFTQGQIQGNLTIDAGSAMYMDYGSIGQNQLIEVYKDVILNGSLSLGDAIGGDLHVKGNWIKDAAASFNPNGRAVTFNASSGDQSITGVTAFDYLTLNKSAGNLLLNNNIICNQNLALTSGKIFLGANNLVVAGNITGGTSANYVVTDGTGALTINNVGATTVTYPVGPSITLYHPATINNSGTADAFSVKVSSVAPACSNADNSVTATWDIAEAVAGGSNCAITLDYTGAAIGGSYNPAIAKIVHCGTPIYRNGSVTGNVVSGTGFTEFSPFGSENDLSVLPVNFNNVKAFQQGSAIKVEWENLTETDMNNYSVERSADGRNFSAIGLVSARMNNGSKATYSFVDATPLSGVNYYRIIGAENNGSKKYSLVVKVNTKAGAVDIVLYPNPVTGGQFSLQASALPKGTYTIKIFNANGQQVQNQVMIHNGGGTAQVISLPAAVKAGMYSLQLSGADVKLTKTFIVR